MTVSIKRTGLVSAIVALASVAACSNSKKAEVDPSLKADLAAVGGGSSGDLQLAPTSAKANVVVSEIEGGPKSAPKAAAPVHVPRPTPRKAPPMAAERQLPVEAPSPAPVVAEPAPAPQPQPQPAIQAPRQQPAQAPQQDHRVYKTEGEVFRQMPWIRP